MEKKQEDHFIIDTKAIFDATKNKVTQSEIMTRAACPRKWYYRYCLQLDRKGGVNPHFVYGELMHEALAILYRSGEYNKTYKEYFIEVPEYRTKDMLLMPGDQEAIEFVRKKVQIAFNSYRMHYYKADSYMRVRAVEQQYRTSFGGTLLEGKIDMVSHPKERDGIFIWDWKTAGRFDAAMLDAWSFRFQFLYYAWLYWRCTGERPSGIMVNGLGKCQLRPKITNKKTKEKETSEEFLIRVRNDMQANREKYFYRQRMPLGKGQLERFEKEMLMPHLRAFALLGQIPTNRTTQTNKEIAIIDSLAMAMNTGNCHVYNSFCEYLPLCKDGPLMLGEYNKREEKHVE